MQRFPFVEFLAMVLSGYAMNDTQQRALTGGVIGAAGGATIGTVTAGNLAAGSAIGVAVGAVGGVVIPQFGHDAMRLLGGD